MTSAVWLLLTFVLSSNLLVYVGFVVADRTLYLPCFGFCLLLVQAIFSLPPSLGVFFTPTAAPPLPAPTDGNHQQRAPPSAITTTTTTTTSTTTTTARSTSFASGPLAVAAAVLAAYVAKQQVQTDRWRDPILLWGEGYRINPGSCITGGEYGMSLTNGQRPRDAVPVLWDTHRRELSAKWFTATIAVKDNGWSSTNNKDGDEKQLDAATVARDFLAQWQRMSNLLQTRFKLVTAMGNAGMCARALPLIEEGLDLIARQVAEIDRQYHQQQQEQQQQLATTTGELTSNSSPSSSPSSSPPRSQYEKARTGLTNSKAYLLISRSRCSSDLATMGHYAGAAVSAQPSMAYAHEYARSVAGLIQDAKVASGLEPEQVAVGWAPHEDPAVQVYERTFSFRASPTKAAESN